MKGSRIREALGVIWWYIKQLFPCLYYTVYAKDNGDTYFCIWRMWFGQCFNVIEVKTDPTKEMKAVLEAKNGKEKE